MLTVSAHEAGHVLARGHRGQFTTALELDRDGLVLGPRLLDWPRYDPPEDELSDLADEELVEPPSVLEALREGTSLAPRCRLHGAALRRRGRRLCSRSEIVRDGGQRRLA